MATAKLSEIVRQTNLETKEAVIASIGGHARLALAAIEKGGGRIIEDKDPEARFMRMAEHYSQLSAPERDHTLVIEPSRDGRDRLNALIRSALVKNGALSRQSIMMDTLESKGLTRAEAGEVASYEKGDVIRFARDYPGKGIDRSKAYRVHSIDQERNLINLSGPGGKAINWHPRQWGAGKAEAFSTRTTDIRAGDQFQFTRNDRALGRVNGLGGQVIRLHDKRGNALIQREDGRREKLSLSNPVDQHIRHTYVSTTFAAQGRTAERVLIHADSGATNLVDQKMLYVALSRARSEAIIVTDDKSKLTRALYERAGEKQTALDSGASQDAMLKSRGAGLA